MVLLLFHTMEPEAHVILFVVSKVKRVHVCAVLCSVPPLLVFVFSLADYPH